MFNILVLALLDYTGGSASVPTKADPGQFLTAAFGIYSARSRQRKYFGEHCHAFVGRIGLYSFAFAAIYLLAGDRARRQFQPE
jgi:hypothetical protein